MYLTVDKESVIKKDKILGIFNLETINKTEEYKNIYEKLKNKNNIKDCESEKKKTIVIYQKDKELYGIVSNISSISIEKRWKNNII